MKQFRPEHMELGEVSDEDVWTNPGSRDDGTKILGGIRSFISNSEFRTGLEKLLEADFLPAPTADRGVPERACGGLSSSISRFLRRS